MQLEIRRGNVDLTIEIKRNALRGTFRGPTESPILLESKFQEIFAAPLDAPPLGSALVPGDTIGVVIDAGLPQPELVVVPLLLHLLTLGIDASKIHAVATESDPVWMNRLTEKLPEELREVQLRCHDPNDESLNAYLATTQDGKRIYLNRHIVEADAFLIVGRIGFDSVVGLQGTASYLYPALADEATRIRSRRLAAEMTPRVQELRQRQRCDEVAWLSGLFFSLGVALDRDNQIERIWFGQYAAVQREGERHARERWQIPLPKRRGKLTIASLSRNEKRASWEAIGSAMELASAIADPEGDIVIVSDLDSPPGLAGRILMDTDGLWNSLAKLRELRNGDPLPMTQCARALSLGRIYVYCDLDAGLLEQMSMVPIASASELQNLIDRAESCFVVEDADRIRVAEPIEVKRTKQTHERSSAD